MKVYKLIVYDSDSLSREIKAECACVEKGWLLDDKKTNFKYWQYTCTCRGSARIVNFKIPGQK